MLSVTLSFLHKLIKLHNLVKAGHKHDLPLAIFEYCVYQSKNSQCKQTHMDVKLNGSRGHSLIKHTGGLTRRSESKPQNTIQK